MDLKEPGSGEDQSIKAIEVPTKLQMSVSSSSLEELHSQHRILHMPMKSSISIITLEDDDDVICDGETIKEKSPILKAQKNVIKRIWNEDPVGRERKTLPGIQQTFKRMKNCGSSPMVDGIPSSSNIVTCCSPLFEESLEDIGSNRTGLENYISTVEKVVSCFQKNYLELEFSRTTDQYEKNGPQISMHLAITALNKFIESYESSSFFQEVQFVRQLFTETAFGTKIPISTVTRALHYILEISKRNSSENEFDGKAYPFSTTYKFLTNAAIHLKIEDECFSRDFTAQNVSKFVNPSSLKAGIQMFIVMISEKSAVSKTLVQFKLKRETPETSSRQEVSVSTGFGMIQCRSFLEKLIDFTNYVGFFELAAQVEIDVVTQNKEYIISLRDVLNGLSDVFIICSTHCKSRDAVRTNISGNASYNIDYNLLISHLFCLFKSLDPNFAESDLGKKIKFELLLKHDKLINGQFVEVGIVALLFLLTPITSKE
ncbi:hypothetical protein L5515_017511 [Caenorhabditis briggsae]|uniref:Uncharacterized protein n=2 Tax=Caenorhabditis briggsae TaxID=6238 RepID=A0AAE9FGP6_CAEBR|nr:hypothetical protein L5515_017511 [Caenorhabditis briggsae]